jgi:ubiquinone/menaquinone biosynthesis C-methylase UbiE
VGRALRVALIAAGTVSGYYAVKLVREYSAERRRPQAFPADRADDLLNPLRAVFMPASRTLRHFDLRPGQTVLELGPGPGYYTIEASRIVGTTGRLLCLDLQQGMIERLVARLGDGAGNVDPLVGDAMRLPLRDGAIDRAFLVTVLGEIPDPTAALAELHRVLAPDGTLAIDETMRDPDYVRVGKLQKMCSEAGFVQIAHHRSPLGYTACFRAG